MEKLTLYPSVVCSDVVVEAPQLLAVGGLGHVKDAQYSRRQPVGALSDERFVGLLYVELAHPLPQTRRVQRLLVGRRRRPAGGLLETAADVRQVGDVEGDVMLSQLRHFEGMHVRHGAQQLDHGRRADVDVPRDERGDENERGHQLDGP